MNVHRVGMPYSFARFKNAEHVCRECQAIGAQQYRAEFERVYGIDRFQSLPVPPCDVCERLLNYVESVVVSLPLYEETPQAHGVKIA